MTCHATTTTKTPTSKKETTYTPLRLRVPFKCHPNTEKYRANTACHTHAQKPPRCTCSVETQALQGYQHITDTSPRHHQITTPPIHHPFNQDTAKNTLHKSMTNVTDHKASAQTRRLYIRTAWAQGDATTQHGLNVAQSKPQVRPT